MVHSAHSITSFWKSLETTSATVETLSETSFSSLKASSDSTAQGVHWIIENRGGLAQIAGGLVIPSQFLGPDFETSQAIIAKSKQFFYGDLIEDISFSFDGSFIRGVIVYPPDWDKNDTSRCVVYNNPNAVTVAGFFDDNQLTWTPKQIQQIHKCPLVLFDYRGTGLSHQNNTSTSFNLPFKPTYESIAVDGLKALEFCADRFTHVDVWGSSLGGGVATVSLDLLLQKKPKLIPHVTLTNHDSFTTTPRVVLPHLKQFADWTGFFVGAYVGAELPMRRLVERNITVTILCHDQDPVIPTGARMADSDFIQNRPNVKIIRSPLYGHANLSPDMMNHLILRC